MRDDTVLPFILLSPQEQTDATIKVLTQVRAALGINTEVSTDEIIARVGDLGDYLEDALILGDPVISDARTVMGSLQARVLPTWMLGTDLTGFRVNLRLYLTRRRAFTYGFDQQLVDTVSLAAFLPSLPEGYIHTLHVNAPHGKPEHSEYLYEAATNTLMLLMHRAANS